MKAKDITKRILIAFMALAMTVAYMPAAAFAAPLEPQGQPAAEESDGSAESQAEESAEEAQDETENTAGEEASEAEDAKAFTREAEADGVIVRVGAGAGAFPENAELSVEKVSKKEEAKAGKAVEEARPDKVKVADSYTFDIKVVDAEGNELQPADGEKVNVSFSMARVADKNLSADVYHITEKEVTDKKTKETKTVLEAERLDAETNRKEETVAAETEGFSLYTVEFTYGELQYVMQGGSDVKASKVLKTVGLEGEIENISVSNEELFSASKKSGEWVIESHKPFKTEEWMKVTIAGVVYEIVVTDAEGDIVVNTWGEMKDAINNIPDGKAIIVESDLTAGNDDERFAVIREGVSFTIDLKGHTINRNLSKDNDNNKGHVFDVNKGTVTIKDSAGGGKLTGGSDENGGAIVIGSEGTVNIENVTISGNRAEEDGGAIYVYGKLNVTGGEISGNTSKSAGGIAVHKDGTITLTDTTIQGNTAKKWGGGGINNKGIATLTNCNISGNKAGNEGGGIYQGAKTLDLIECTITGNSAPGGGGICCFGTVTATNTNIDNNTANNDGGGLAVHGTFNMTGGSVSGNKAEDGGGVYNDDGNIDFKDVTIERNKSKKYGGAGINNKRHAVLENCTIKNNEGHASGGGIYSDDDITLDNCTIEGNSATGDGGGIHSEDSKVNLNNCIIKNNSAAKSGGGIRIHDGTTNLYNTTIEGNIAYELGGGIYTNNDATLNISGDTRICGNSAAGGGGGMLIGDSEDNKVTIRDKLLVTENESSKGSNVYFKSRLKKTGAGSWERTQIIVTPLSFTGPLAEGSAIGVAIDQEIVDNSEAITSGYKKYHGDKDPHEIFEAESGYALQTNTDGEIVIHVSEWPDLQRLINTAANGDGKLKLDKNWKGKDADAPLTIPEGKTLELDLNGHIINRNIAAEAAESGRVFNVEGGRTLKIIDSSGKQSGRITGGNSTNGGAVYVQSGGSLEFTSGNITGNKAENGGAIYNEGTVTINGKGLISGNNGTNGGGIYNAGTLNIKSDSVKGNLADTGGGIYSAAGTVNLESAVSGNEASEKAGGIYYAEGSILNVSANASVKDNNGASGTNIYMAGDSTLINVTSSLSDAAYIDVVAQNPNAKNDRKLTNDWDVNKGSGTLAYNGIASDSSDKVKVEEGELWLKAITGEGIEWISSWRELSRALKKNEVRNIALAKDLKPGDSDKDYPLEVINAKKTLDLCGHTLDSNGTKFAQGTGIGTSDIKGMVISVGSTCLGGDTASGELELKDSIGTGAVTGGNCDSITYPVGGGGILITKNSKCTISGVAITGNKSDKDGGGIYNKGSLTMTGGAVTGNKAGYDYCEKDEGRGGGIFNAGTIILNGVRISENTSYNGGGGIFIKSELSSDITDCLIDNNQTLSGHGGGVYADMSGKTLKIEGGEINDNLAYEEDTLEKIPYTEDYRYFENNGGGIYLKSGILNMTNAYVSGNTSEGGGGIYNEAGSINLNGTEISGNTAKSQIAINDETHTPTLFGGTGGGIYTKGSAVLGNSIVSGNSAGNTGGGIYTKKSLAMTDGAVTANQSETEGGGIHFAGGSLKLTGSGAGGLTIEGNEAMDEASGIRADQSPSIEGEIHMDDNSLWLASGKKVTIDSVLGDGSMINVALADTWGVFTDGFKDKHPGADPANYFRSDYGYGVHRTSDGEAELRLDLDDGSHFIDMDNQINDESRLTKANWMSGISGDRYLNEINIPCTHDSAMNVVNYNTFSSVGSALGFSENAKTQVRFIDEQMNDGVRRLDIRLNNRYEKAYVGGLWISYKDDGKNLWLCHGKSWFGTFWAGDHEGDDLSFNETWEWVKDFLQKHPTETIMLDLAAEPVNSWGHNKGDDKKTIAKRAQSMVRDFSKEINPSTGKPYVFWENYLDGEPAVMQPFSRYPQLKECRGQVIFTGDLGVGGIESWDLDEVKSDEPKGEHGESADDKIQHTYDFFNKDNTLKLKFIPTDVTKHIDKTIYTASALTAPLGIAGMPVETPLVAADKIHEALWLSDNDDTGVFNQRGQYVGWIRHDGATTKTNRIIWISNFPEDDEETDVDEALNYCTVTAISNIDEAEAEAAGIDPKKVAPQTYKLLKGTEFPIPGNIYGYNKELQGWNASVPSGEETGGDTAYHQGDTYKVMSDVTFTADWGSEEPEPAADKTRVRAIWVDQDDKDKIRPNSLTIKYKTDGETGEKTVALPTDGKWTTAVDGMITEVLAVNDSDSRINPTADNPHGQDKQGEYAYAVINNKLTGCIVTLHHTPVTDPDPDPGEDTKVYTGKVTWDDNSDEKGIRPDTVTLHLMKDGQEIDERTISGDGESWSWRFVLPDDQTGYYVNQDAVPGYKTAIKGSPEDGFEIVNTLMEEGHKHSLSEVKAVPATCTKDGNIRYWVCDKGDDPCHKIFADSKGTREISKADTVVKAAGHDWGKAVYEWADDNSTVTGKCICNNDPEHVIEETVRTSSEITKQPTETEEGVRTYTAVFKGDNPFENQTKTESIPPTGKPGDDMHIITLDDGSGKGTKTEVYEEGSRVTIPSAPSDDKFFKKWKLKLFDGGGNELADVTEDIFGKGGNNNDVAEFTMPVSGVTEYTNGNGEKVKFPDEYSLLLSADCKEKISEATINPTAPVAGEELADTIHIAFDNGSWIDCPVNWTYKDKAGRADVVVPASGNAYNDTEYTATIRIPADADKNRVFANAVKALSTTGTPVSASFTPAEDGSITIALTFEKTAASGGEDRPVIPPEYRTITFKLNGGTYNGSRDDIVIKAEEGDVITVPAAPEREGCKFAYWEGSKYYPGDKYTVTADHTMTARWTKASDAGSGGSSGSNSSRGAGTGDSTDILMWIAVILAALLALTGTAAIRRRRQK